MICDSLAAGMTYQKENWTNNYQFDYYKNARKKARINPITDKILLEVYETIANEGIDNVINKKTLKKIYEKHAGDINDKKY